MQLQQNVISAINKSTFPFNIGIEREGLRVDKAGILSQKNHPEAFGEKLQNFHFKTDFCESQPELVTAVLHSTKDAYDALAKLTDTLKNEIAKDDEFFWGQSMPCVLPAESEIKTAIHPGDFAKPLRDYLAMVREKYTAKHQTLCGIHFNFSLSDEFWCALQKLEGNTDSLKEFKNSMYMKMLKNYYKHSWFTLLFTGCSPAVHNTFDRSLSELVKKDDYLISHKAPSLHFSKIGYHNPKPVEVDYSTLDTLCDSLIAAVNEKKLIDQGELFAPIKVKAKDNVYLVDSFKNDGVLYLEIRNIDLNMFDKYALSKNDMDFLILFLLYMLIIPENNFDNWVRISNENNIIVAENGLDYSQSLQQGDSKISIGEWVNKLTDELIDLNRQLNICSQDAISEITTRLIDPTQSYAARAYNEILAHGFIPTCMNYAK